MTFWSDRISFFDGLQFLEGGLSLVFALALVIQTLGFAGMLNAFKVRGLNGAASTQHP